MAVGVAERGREKALAQIAALGARVITVSAEPGRNQGTRARTGGIVTTLTLENERAIVRGVDGVAGAAAEYRQTVPVTVGGLARRAMVAGVEPSYAWLRGGEAPGGRWFTAREDRDESRVAVIGATLARDLFEGRDPVGELIRVRGMPFVIIGELAPRGVGLDAFNEDEALFIPLRTLRRRLFPVTYVQRLFVLAKSRATLSEVEASIAGLLRRAHPHRAGEPADVRVQDQRRLVTLEETTVGRLRQFQVVVSGALLALSTIGVLALQLLAVRERRAEIGTRRALGATRGMIFGQFFAEGAALTLAGTLAGAALGDGAAGVAGLPLSPVFLLLAAAVLCAAGIVAAAEPARRAAGLLPAVALRER